MKGNTEKKTYFLNAANYLEIIPFYLCFFFFFSSFSLLILLLLFVDDDGNEMFEHRIETLYADCRISCMHYSSKSCSGFLQSRYKFRTSRHKSFDILYSFCGVCKYSCRKGLLIFSLLQSSISLFRFFYRLYIALKCFCYTKTAMILCECTLEKSAAFHFICEQQ